MGSVPRGECAPLHLHLRVRRPDAFRHVCTICVKEDACSGRCVASRASVRSSTFRAVVMFTSCSTAIHTGQAMIAPDFAEYFTGEARKCLVQALDLALAEDGPDLTSDGIFSPVDRLQALIVAKAPVITAGLPVIPLVMERCPADPAGGECTWQALVAEGTLVEPGTVVARLAGPARQLLRTERVILNMISHISGVATLTRRYVEALRGTGVRLLDTRKTLPGLRYPAKYGVVAGGGCNHRRNLAEMLMIKDNHIDAAGSMTLAVQALRKAYAACPPIEVECRTPDEVREAVAARVDRIMLDNMDAPGLNAALALIPAGIETEVSGGVSLDNLRALATPGQRHPDFISVGRLTHSAPAADFSMRISKEGA